ncbi:MAG: hypothetical protein C0624_13610 [Desulfuromonas sp.]|nr:MAG: hypothetical protein C0624_13610 [Desulfuromonas sp.]
MTREGVHMVVMRAEIDYLKALTSGDRFRVELRPQRKTRRKAIFYQQIVRSDDEAIMLKAKVLVGIVAGHPRAELPPTIARLLENFPQTPPVST